MINYIYVAIGTLLLALLLLLYISSLKSDISDLNEKLESAKIYLNTTSINEVACKEKINIQNTAIDKIKVDKEKALKELDIWKSKPRKIRYEKIYENTPTIEEKSDDCKDIKAMLDDIRNSGF